MTATRTPLAAGIALLALVLSSCTVQNVQLRTDDRLHITAPRSRAVVATPVTVRWSMRDFDAAGLDGRSVPNRGAFVVFVDRAPMPAGKTLTSVANGDKSCELDPRCPDEKYLADRGVYVTTETSLTLAELPPVTAGRGNEQHYVNVVLVDGTGRRVGESAWYRQFQSRRTGS
jgi:hypothetical protein